MCTTIRQKEDYVRVRRNKKAAPVVNVTTGAGSYGICCFNYCWITIIDRNPLDHHPITMLPASFR